MLTASDCLLRCMASGSAEVMCASNPTQRSASRVHSYRATLRPGRCNDAIVCLLLVLGTIAAIGVHDRHLLQLDQVADKQFSSKRAEAAATLLSGTVFIEVCYNVARNAKRPHVATSNHS